MHPLAHSLHWVETIGEMALSTGNLCFYLFTFDWYSKLPWVTVAAFRSELFSGVSDRKARMRGWCYCSSSHTVHAALGDQGATGRKGPGAATPFPVQSSHSQCPTGWKDVPSSLSLTDIEGAWLFSSMSAHGNYLTTNKGGGAPPFPCPATSPILLLLAVCCFGLRGFAHCEG